MHTIFELPSPWTCEVDGQLWTWTRPDFPGRVECDGLSELPVDRKLWGERVLSRYLDDGGSITQLDIANSQSYKGWPLTMVTTAALDAKGKRVDTRITMFYEFLYFGSTLAAIIPNSGAKTWEDELREPVIEAMLHAMPSFAGKQVANVAELWDMGDAPQGVQCEKG